MIEAHSLDSIIENIYKSLSDRVMVFRGSKSDTNISFLKALDSISNIQSNIEVIHPESSSKLIGLLFCHPKSEIGEKYLRPRINYYHHRSGKFVDFYCAGYGAYWPPGHYLDQEIVVNLKGTKWQFSDSAFNSIREDLEIRTNWTYSGESDLILLTARKSDSKDSILDFTTAIACNLEQMEKDGAFNSVSSFFEDIFRFGESYSGDDPVWDLSDREGLKQGKNFLKNFVLGRLPKELEDSYRSAKHYAVRDISK